MSFSCGADFTAWRPEKVRELCEDSLADSGFYGLSLFAALDSDVPGLCRSVPRLRSPGTIWVATCGELPQRGFGLLATDARPHFDIVLAAHHKPEGRPQRDLLGPSAVFLQSA
jgi:hypothetical protein